MSKTDQKELLDQLRGTHARLAAASIKAPVIAKPGPKITDLEAYKRISLVRSAGMAMGIESPLFRQIDAQSGTEVVIDGRTVVNFASYDYLSLNQDQDLRNTVQKAVAQWGVSATASRLVGGNHEYHAQLERKVVELTGAEDAVALISGYLTNCTAIRTLVEAGDLVLVDARAHNSIYEGIRVSGADHVSFPHNDWNWVDDYLASNRARFRNVLIAIEGLYSMDGDTPDLARYVDIKKRHGTWLLVDEAHSIGVLGKTGRGLCEEQGIARVDVDVTIGTLSKAFCSSGGFIAGSRELVDLIRYGAPGFVYSVGLSAPVAAAASHAIDRLLAEPTRVDQLKELSIHFRRTANGLGLDSGGPVDFAIQPIMIGDSVRATSVSNALLLEGFNVLPIIAPAVPDKSARLRFFLNFAHSKPEIETVLNATARLL
ncbi:MAG: pyridoxal phosphate-dependent aminotransferase family protein, partial [Pseudomonadota bacterium]